MNEFNVQHLANTAWAFATVERAQERLFTVFAKIVELRVGEVDAHSLANMAWGFAMVLGEQLLHFTLRTNYKHSVFPQDFVGCCRFP